MVGPQWTKKARSSKNIEEESWKDQKKSESIFRMVDNVPRIQTDAVLTLLCSGSKWLIEKLWTVVQIAVTVRAKAYGYRAAWFMGLRVRISLRTWMFLVFVVCYVGSSL